MSRNFEKLIEYIINNDETRARKMFHEIVVIEFLYIFMIMNKIKNKILKIFFISNNKTMSDSVNTLHTKSQPILIKCSKNCYNFSDFNNNKPQYFFELTINGKNIGEKYFRNVEEIKYSHLIKLDDEIILENIEKYNLTVRIFQSGIDDIYKLKGKINQHQSNSTSRSNQLYIEFTKNSSGYAMCSCFYTGLDHNKMFASPPN